MTTRVISVVFLSYVISMLAGCSFTPKQPRPHLPIPHHYKESGRWVAANPTLARAKKTEPWWWLYHDKTLTKLEEKLTCSNLSLQIALARYQEAAAIAQATRSQKYPKVLGLANFSRQQNSATTVTNANLPFLLYNTALFAATLTYELDLWGRVRSAVAADEHTAHASDADRAAMDLSLHALLAMQYFDLRGSDEAQRVLDKTVIAYQKALYLTQQQHQGGIVSSINVDEAQAALHHAQTQALDMHRQRAQQEHAMAVLVGAMPSTFHIKPQTLRIHPVQLSADLPSELLQRRPDIAAAVQRVKAANATIGIARAAFYPVINIMSLAGYQSRSLATLLSTPSLFWSLGPFLAGITPAQSEVQQILFDGFKLQANVAIAKARYFAAVSAYRQTVLTAFQNVEDSLVALRQLDQELITQRAETMATQRVWHQTQQQQQEGIITYLGVLPSQIKVLQAELALTELRVKRQKESIRFIKALGGGWKRRCGSNYLPVSHADF